MPPTRRRRCCSHRNGSRSLTGRLDALSIGTSLVVGSPGAALRAFSHPWRVRTGGVGPALGGASSRRSRRGRLAGSLGSLPACVVRSGASVDAGGGALAHPSRHEPALRARRPPRQGRRDISAHAASTDVYVGVLPRWRRRGGRGAVAGDARTVWVDFDTPDAESRLASSELAPHMLVRSGGPGHVHAYWMLRRAVAPEEVERANRRLA